MSDSLSCDDVNIGCPFTLDLDDTGEVIYDWCNIKFTDGNLCGGATSSLGASASFRRGCATQHPYIGRNRSEREIGVQRVDSRQVRVARKCIVA